MCNLPSLEELITIDEKFAKNLLEQLLRLYKEERPLMEAFKKAKTINGGERIRIPLHYGRDMDD